MHKTERGFTLIELLIVIAIIAVLSSIVIIALHSAQISAYDAKAKAELADARNSAESYSVTYDSYGSVTSSCSSGMFGDTDSGMAAYTNLGNYPATSQIMACSAEPNAYAMSINLSDGTYWCIDSTGTSGLTTTGGPLIPPDTVCP